LLPSFHELSFILTIGDVNAGKDEKEAESNNIKIMESTFKTALRQGRRERNTESENAAASCFQRGKNKKSPRPRQTLRIAPASSSSPVPQPSREQDHFSGQVFWLMVRPTPRAFPSVEPDSGVGGFRPHSQRRDREGFTPSSLTRKSLM